MIIATCDAEIEELKNGYKSEGDPEIRERVLIIIRLKSGVRYTRRHIRRMAQEWGYALIMPRKKHKNSATDEEVEQFNKKAAKILASLRKGMTAVCMDESVFVYDSVVSKVWDSDHKRRNKVSWYLGKAINGDTENPFRMLGLAINRVIYPMPLKSVKSWVEKTYLVRIVTDISPKSLAAMLKRIGLEGEKQK